MLDGLVNHQPERGTGVPARQTFAGSCSDMTVGLLQGGVGHGRPQLEGGGVVGEARRQHYSHCEIDRGRALNGEGDIIAVMRNRLHDLREVLQTESVELSGKKVTSQTKFFAFRLETPKVEMHQYYRRRSTKDKIFHETNPHLINNKLLIPTCLFTISCGDKPPPMYPPGLYP